MADEPPHNDEIGNDEIGYAERAQNALLSMVRDIITLAAQEGLPGKHHFYISFATRMPAVQLSAELRDTHPEDMTIVLQNQFDDLQVATDEFSVNLKFNGTSEHIVVPFSAITKFYDPSVAFGLMFETIALTPDEAGETSEDALKEDALKEETFGEVISLDNFRK